MIASALKRFFSSASLKEQAHVVYIALVTQARQPIFFRDWQVEDTIDGRFDVILLHLYLVLARCEEGETEQAHLFMNELSDVFFADMDRSLREMGASDTGVGKRVKKMAQAFYGRLKAYREAGLNDVLFMEALRRNMYRERPVSDTSLAAVMGYVHRNRQALRQQPLDEILAGRLIFSD